MFVIFKEKINDGGSQGLMAVDVEKGYTSLDFNYVKPYLVMWQFDSTSGIMVWEKFCLLYRKFYLNLISATMSSLFLSSMSLPRF